MRAFHRSSILIFKGHVERFSQGQDNEKSLLITRALINQSQTDNKMYVLSNNRHVVGYELQV